MARGRAALERPGWQVWVGHCQSRASALRSLNLGVSFPAVRSLTLLSLADPLLSVASTAWMSAVQRKEPVANARFLPAQFHESSSRAAAVRVGRQPTLWSRSILRTGGRQADFQARHFPEIDVALPAQSAAWLACAAIAQG